MSSLDYALQTEHLIQTQFPDGTKFVYRLLSLKEYERIKVLRASGQLVGWSLASFVFQRCYLGNYDLIPGNLPAGYEITLGNLILWLSGDCEAETLVEDLAILRDQYKGDSLNEYMKRIVLIACPAYKIEEINEWNRLKLLENFVIAETILANRGGYTPIDLRKIQRPGQKTARQEIDFRRENARLNSEMGDAKHFTEMSPEEFAQKTKLKKMVGEKRALSQQDARKLDKIRGR